MDIRSFFSGGGTTAHQEAAADAAAAPGTLGGGSSVRHREAASPSGVSISGRGVLVRVCCSVSLGGEMERLFMAVGGWSGDEWSESGEGALR